MEGQHETSADPVTEDFYHMLRNCPLPVGLPSNEGCKFDQSINRLSLTQFWPSCLGSQISYLCLYLQPSHLSQIIVAYHRAISPKQIAPSLQLNVRLNIPPSPPSTVPSYLSLIRSGSPACSKGTTGRNCAFGCVQPDSEHAGDTLIYVGFWGETPQLHLLKVVHDIQIPKDSIKVKNYPYLSHAGDQFLAMTAPPLLTTF